MTMSDVTPEEVAEIVAQIQRGDDTYAIPDALVEEPPPGSPPPTHEVNRGLYHQILGMTVGEKIKLALKGNREARNILIRDASHIVPRFVLQNPRITEDEVAAVARNRNADTDLLRIIGEHKEWSRLHQVRSALVHNPKTPVVLALRYVSSLPDRELRLLAKSKNVQSAVCSSAKRLILQRTGH
jgi:hypothetical protein